MSTTAATFSPDSPSLWDRTRSVARWWQTWWAAVVIVALVVVAIFAPLIATHDPIRNALPDALQAPWGLEGGGSDHLLGADQNGRDLFSRIVFGSRITLGVALLTLSLSATLGSLLGLLAGYRGGLTDTLVMRLADILLSLPIFLLAIVVAAALGPSLGNVIGIIAVLLWPYFARQIRGETLALKNLEYVEASRALGASDVRIMLRHILPNLVPSIIVFATLQANLVIVAEASLSFLGVGVPPPAVSWGRMVSEGIDVVYIAWWAAALPGIAISLVVLSVAFLGDTMRDRLDPTLRGR